MVEPMKSVAASKFSARVDHFLRWFFSASPDFVLPAPMKLPSRPIARRKRPHVQPPPSGPARVAVKAKK